LRYSKDVESATTNKLLEGIENLSREYGHLLLSKQPLLARQAVSYSLGENVTKIAQLEQAKLLIFKISSGPSKPHSGASEKAQLIRTIFQSN
jgi:hypothetical protein